MKFIIQTVCDAYTNYTVEANSIEEAKELYEDAKFIDEHIYDYANEEILEVRQA